LNVSADPGQVVLSAPYPEGAIVQLARHAEQFHGEVKTFLPSRVLSVSAGRVIDRSRGLETRLTRGSADLPGAEYICPSLEALRLAGRVPGLRRALPSNMDYVKKAFDRAVARKTRDGVAALVAMPGAALQSFRQANVGTRVFHAVDAHPGALNTVLTAHYGSRADREKVLAAQVERISHELELADIVMSPSVLVRDQMIDSGLSRDAIEVIPYGVNFGTFAPTSSRSVNSVPHLLYVGQISYRKGIPFLLDAVRNQPMTVELVGPVVARELLVNLPDNVRYRSAVGHDELPALFGRADALVLPSVLDAYALVVTESLGSGLPVITTHSVGSSVLIHDERDGAVVAAGEVAELRAALRDVSPQTPDERSSRASRHRSARTGVQDWDAYARAVASAIGSAL